MLAKKLKKAALRVIGNIFIFPGIHVLCNTLKIKKYNEDFHVNNKNIVFLFWHGTMLAPWYILKKFDPAAIVSKSKDGGLLAKILLRWKYDVSRGSSSSGGKEVLDELLQKAKDGKNIAITPDGPRGPSKKMKAGGVVIAKKAQIPIVLIGVNYKNKKKLKSWDSFEIPKPFSKVTLVFSDPITIDQNYSYEETDLKIKELSVQLNTLQKEAEKFAEIY